MSRIHMFMAGAAGFYMMLAPFGAASAADEPVTRAIAFAPPCRAG